MTTQPIVLVPHDPQWRDAFEMERDAILGACGGRVKAVHHIGSTAIPGIAAKPIIDIMPVLARYEDGAACIEPMNGLGYAYRGDGGIEGRYYFTKGSPRTHHVHIFAANHPEIDRHLRFRDYLRAHPDEAHRYEVLKRQLAVSFAVNGEAYTEAKGEFSARIDRLALGS